MLAFKYRMFAPPGGRWFYTVPETGRYFETPSCFDQLVSEVRRHYAVNNLAIPANLEALIEDHICNNVIYGFCCGEDPRDPDDMPPTYFEITAAMERFFRGKKYEYATAEVARKRAETCMVCPMNSLALCTNCTGLKSTARRFVGGRRLDAEMRLGVCRRIRVPTNALVHVNFTATTTRPLPENCWLVPRK